MDKLKRVDILGKTYKVGEKLPKSEKFAMIPNEYMGLCMDDVAHIYLNSELREGEEYWTTLFHEFGHGVMYRNGLRFSGAIPMEIEEIIVETMANAYYGLFKTMLKDLTKDGNYSVLRDKVRSFCRETK